jgi:molybdopterin-guanine dinucleotide biosynthesis protein MobB
MGSPVVGVAGWKNSGMTTLMTRLAAELTGRGYCIATVMHPRHDADIDHEGTDSFRTAADFESHADERPVLELYQIAELADFLAGHFRLPGKA